MLELERHEGHFYNWYDTRTLQPLPPLYVSAVDSGNLAGHLLTLRPGLARAGGRADRARALVRGPARHAAGAARKCGRVRAGVASRACGAAWTRLRSIDARPRRPRWRAARTAADVDREACRRGRRHARIVRRRSRRSPARRPSGPRRSCASAGRCRRRSSSSRPGPRCPRRRRPARISSSSSMRRACGRWRCRFVVATGDRTRTQASRATGSRVARRVSRSARAGQHPRRRAHRRDRTAGRAMRAISRRWSTGSCTTPRATCSPIGYNVDEHRRDTSYYDLLASEARFASFVCIAQGKLPQENWFALGRLLTTSGRRARAAVVERLDVRVPDAAAGDADVRGHAARPDLSRDVSPGRSPTASSAACRGASPNRGYNAVDAGLNYQYRAFGVPGLGLKRGLADDLVVAPYASALALMVAPEAACREPAAAGARRRSRGASACTRRSTTRRRACRADRRA